MIKTLAITLLLSFTGLASCANIVCYYSSWAIYRQGPGHYEVANIDPTLCTHLVYSFAKLSWEGELQTYDDWNDVGDDWHEGQFEEFRELRKRNPNVKLIIAVGGWNHGPGSFQEVVVNAQKRQKWVQSSIDFLHKYGFDGLDIDWEYQDSVGGTPEQKAGFSETLRLFRQRFNQEGLILSAATTANFNLIDANYDLAVMSETLDFINLMAYDLHGAWEPYTGHLAPLHKSSLDQGTDANLNVAISDKNIGYNVLCEAIKIFVIYSCGNFQKEAIVRRYIERGANPAKINIGFPLYGRGFTLADPANNGLYAPTTGPSSIGQYVPEAGILGYIEICQNKWPEIFDNEQGVPHAVQGNQWVGYDNKQSLIGKMNYLKQEFGINGYMVWSIETDDWSGVCSGTPYPLMKAINENAKRLS